MVEYKILYSKLALKDAKKLTSANLDKKAKELIEIIRKDPFKNPPPYEKLVGNLNGSYSRRINIQHRLVYEVRENEKKVRISRMWSHYGE
ncbi:Txe/YoeB family addiction module toxin [Sulfurospirillum sp. 1307]|jgi:Txe/YoeB family toxin of toxin-antitoxin system